MGPVGLLIETVLWHGMMIDKDLKLWQKNEVPLDILRTPYQDLKALSLGAATRARTRAERKRETSNMLTRECLELDREASMIDPKMPELEKGIIRTAQMGGNMDKAAIAKFDEDVSKECTYCFEGDATTDHLLVCKHFRRHRADLDSKLAEVPVSMLPLNVRKGMAPAMKLNGKATFWGKELGDDISDATKRMLGCDLELHTPGDNGDETEARERAREIADEPEHKYLNARQVILSMKEAHGPGVDITFPTTQEIYSNMVGRADDYYVRIYGDGSLKNPNLWWAALGDLGIWIPDWSSDLDHTNDRGEVSTYGPAIGQTGTSTRQELLAWLMVLAIPVRSYYATDSASLISKANRLIEAVRKD